MFLELSVRRPLISLIRYLNQTQIQFINVRHEQGAAFMADVYGRLSKKAGVCLSTLGPGATNLLTGISSAISTIHLLWLLIGTSWFRTALF